VFHVRSVGEEGIGMDGNAHVVGRRRVDEICGMQRMVGRRDEMLAGMNAVENFRRRRRGRRW